MKSMKNIRLTDIIHHFINLVADMRPVYKGLKRYNLKKREFTAKVFPEMEEAGIIM